MLVFYLCTSPGHISRRSFLGSLMWAPLYMGTVNSIDNIIFTFRVPQWPYAPFQSRPQGTFRSWAFHRDHVSNDGRNPKEPHWEMMNAQFQRIENLCSLQFGLLSLHPDFRGKERLYVQRYASHLPSLRNRPNFTLTFTIDGEVVPWVVMPPPPLPFELHLEVLKSLVSHTWDPGDRVRTLATCSLVCWDWCRLCQIGLMRAISLRSRRQLTKLVTSLSSATYPSGAHVIELSLAGEDIHHIAPVYLATKVPSLRRLVIDGGPKLDHQTIPKLYPVPSLLTMHLNHFRAVTELCLSNVAFQSFWDFRRLIVALPTLSNLRLSNIHLPIPSPFRRHGGRVPSLYTSPRNLSHLYIRSEIDWNPLWIWVIPFQTRPHKSRNLHLHPVLTPHDAETIWKLSNLDERLDEISFDWLYNEEQQRCESFVLASCRETCNIATV